VFVSSAPFEVFDYFRVPYTVDTKTEARDDRVGWLRPADADDDAPSLHWRRQRQPPTGPRLHRGIFDVAGSRLAGRVSKERPEWLLEERGDTWSPAVPITDPDGRHIADVWTSERGDTFLPFDPGDVMTCLWSEEYRKLGAASRLASAARHAAVRGYYAVRPAVPRSVQLTFRKHLASRGPEPAFPRWPLETGLHDMYGWLLDVSATLAGAPVPYIAPWPDGAQWCMVLTHDVETAQGCEDIDLLRDPERRTGHRSSWNFVPARYATPPETVAGLQAEGCEVGVHGLRHDGRDLASKRVLRTRVPAMREAAARWGATGFRSPATHRDWSLMPRLGFDYDSSYTDTDPYEPQPGGCCAYLPFFNQNLVELPITLPQDHTLYSILGHGDGTLWIEKGRELRRRGGMLLALSHPDYAHGVAAEAWLALLEEFRSDPTRWQPLPREVARWWRARAASSVVADGGTWRIVGPAAQRGRVVEVEPAHSKEVA
jgi:hypothetical protein